MWKYPQWWWFVCLFVTTPTLCRAQSPTPSPSPSPGEIENKPVLTGRFEERLGLLQVLVPLR